LLALDRNHDGVINDGAELFGNSTKLASGAAAADGYAALRELDSNGDGIISAADTAYGDLRVWVDTNADGVSQAAELHTLADLKITQVSTNANAASQRDNGNWIGLTSSYQTVDGSTHETADVWFNADKSGLAPVDPAPLQAKVGDMVQALAGFDNAGVSSQAASNLQFAQGAGQSATAVADIGKLVALLHEFSARDGLFNAGTSGMAAAGKPAPTLQLPTHSNIFLPDKS
jgi:hypothetical protein